MHFGSDWTESYWEKWLSGGALANPDFITWMKPAAQPTFRKVFRKMSTHLEGCEDDFKGLCKGVYNLKIDYS